MSKTSITKIADDKGEAAQSDTDECNAMLQKFLDSPEAVKEFLEDFSMKIERLNTNPLFRRRLAEDVMKQVHFRTLIISGIVGKWSKE